MWRSPRWLERRSASYGPSRASAPRAASARPSTSTIPGPPSRRSIPLWMPVGWPRQTEWTERPLQLQTRQEVWGCPLLLLPCPPSCSERLLTFPEPPCPEDVALQLGIHLNATLQSTSRFDLWGAKGYNLGPLQRNRHHVAPLLTLPRKDPFLLQLSVALKEVTCRSIL